MISARQALPLQSSVGGIHWLPANHGRFMLDEVHSIPMGLPSASLATLVRHGRSGLLPSGNGASTRKPTKLCQGATRLKSQKYSSSGAVQPRMGPIAMYLVRLTGSTLCQSLAAPSATPLVLSQGNKNRFPAGYSPYLP